MTQVTYVAALTRPSRWISLSVLFLVGAVLTACGGSDDEGVPGGTIEDLPADARLVVRAAGAAPFDGDAAAFLAILPFVPVLPDSVPGDRTLATATIVPSREPSGKADLAATLILEYRGEDDTSVQITEQRQPMQDLSALADETVQVGDAEALLIAFAESESLQLVWHDCDLTFAISSSALDRDALVEMAESMTDECPGAVG